MKETGEQEYASAASAVGPAAGPRGRLELLMDKCVSLNGARVARDDGCVAFRRRGYVYALEAECADVDIKELRTTEERSAADTLAGRIRSGNLRNAAFRKNGPTSRFFIASHHYLPDNETGREYEIPENAKWVRTGRGKIRFYSGELPEHKARNNDKRRQYHAVPEGAVKVKRILSRFEWLVPDGSAYKWKKT